MSDLVIHVVGRVRVALPRDAVVLASLDLDEFYGGGSGVMHGDAFIRLLYRGVYVSVIIEDTGVPELRDFEKIVNTVDLLRRNGLIGVEDIVVKVLHHSGGLRPNLFNRLKRRFAVEAQRCGGLVDLASILRKRLSAPSD